MDGSQIIATLDKHVAMILVLSVCATLYYVVDCGNLTDPVNGNVMVSGTLEGDTAEYSCTEGYELNENATRTCESNGTWSGEEPTCISTLSQLLTTRKNQAALHNIIIADALSAL